MRLYYALLEHQRAFVGGIVDETIRILDLEDNKEVRGTFSCYIAIQNALRKMWLDTAYELSDLDFTTQSTEGRKSIDQAADRVVELMGINVTENPLGEQVKLMEREKSIAYIDVFHRMLKEKDFASSYEDAAARAFSSGDGYLRAFRKAIDAGDITAGHLMDRPVSDPFANRLYAATIQAENAALISSASECFPTLTLE